MLYKEELNRSHLPFYGVLVLLLMLIFLPIDSKATQTKVITKIKKELVYIVTDNRIPFWKIMGRGIKNSANSLGYSLKIYSADNSKKRELEITMQAIKDKVSGIIVSPTTSSSCVTILKLAKNAGIPVVVADVGADSGEYVSYISSNNRDGAYKIGKILAENLIERGWEKGRVAIVAIPQKRLNGKARTAGFMQAMDENNIKGADIKQLKTWSEDETYNFTKEMIGKYKNLRAIWLQTSNIYNGALRALFDSGKKNDILLVTFDAEPEFLELITKGVIIGSAMQQPYLMGQEALRAIDMYLNGKHVDKNIELPILAISSKNINQKLKIIRKTVLGIEK